MRNDRSCPLSPHLLKSDLYKGKDAEVLLWSSQRKPKRMKAVRDDSPFALVTRMLTGSIRRRF